MIEKKKKKKKKKLFFFIFFFLKAIKFTESAAFCRVGRVTGNNNKFLLGLILSSAPPQPHPPQCHNVHTKKYLWVSKCLANNGLLLCANV